MKNHFYTNEEITRYLLGEVTEAERDQFEEALLNTEVLTQIEERESELIDGYVRGSLDSHLRLRFQQRCADNPALRGRVEIARTLLPKLIHRRTSTPNLQSDWGQTLASTWRNQLSVFRLGWAIALLLILAVSTWMLHEIRRLRDEVYQLSAAQSGQSQREQTMERQIATERERSNQLAADLERWRNQTAGAPTPESFTKPLFATLTLTAAGLRGNERTATPRVNLTAAQQELHLQLQTLPAKSASYRAELLTAADRRLVWRVEKLKPIKRDGSAFMLIVPTDKLPDGEYIIKVDGIETGGDTFPIINTNFVVARQ